jgi:hypothetical protein
MCGSLKNLPHDARDARVHIGIGPEPQKRKNHEPCYNESSVSRERLLFVGEVKGLSVIDSASLGPFALGYGP